MRPEFADRELDCLHVGLVNNMPGSAMEATERQFCALLDAAADGVIVRLTLFALPSIVRQGEELRRINSVYSTVRDLWNIGLDGIIITGTEPQAANLEDEPYWRDFGGLADWAGHSGCPAVWSCLAAHAAVQWLDGIKRNPLGAKLSGVFECERTTGIPLTQGLPHSVRMPHSRWNGVSEQELEACGYQVLTRSKRAGPDAFVRPGCTLFTFFQGHPEYEGDSLWLEYRRDIRRYLKGERDGYPAMPEGYFEPGAIDAFTALRERALSDRRPELLEQIPPVPVSREQAVWQPAATIVYRNWLCYLRSEKEKRLRSRRRDSRESVLGHVVGTLR